MRYTAIPLLEESFRRTGNNGEYALQEIAIPIPGEALKLDGLLCTPKNRSGYYYDVAHPKQRIVIHYTAGSLRSDIATLTAQDRHVSVPFVIARDGTIYQLFSSRFWSGHLGKGVGNTNTANAQDKCTIAIELSNYGWLTEHQGALETCYSRLTGSNGSSGPADVYCLLADNDAYQKLATSFREKRYYATFSKAQYESLIVLLRYLTTKYNIPRQFLPEALRYQTTQTVLQFRGIVSHVNYRTDGKWDLGPAFDWNMVIAGVQAEAFQPTVSRSSIPATRGNAKKAILSEEELEPLLPAPQDAAREDESYEEVIKLDDGMEPDDGLKKSAAQKGQKKLFALLVGLDEYNEQVILNNEVVFPKLSGCVRDTKRMKTYLEADPAFDTKIEMLANEQATKKEIARLFREHLGQAKAGDSALFFFSGHGTQEWADSTTWKEDTDGKLECIVCYYDKEADDLLMTDKELRYLIHELAHTGAHITALFDCCHSADNTRNGALVKKEFTGIVEKRVPYVFPKRSWQQFLFSDAISQADVKQQGESVLLPEGEHIQFSACESNESALEVSGSGVFTKALLQVLKASGGDVSYQSLGGRIRQYLKNVYEQKPRIYVAGGDTAILASNFLNRPSTGRKRTLGELVYNEERGWKLTLGAIHGITEQTRTITIIDPDTARQYEGTVGDIEIDGCYVNTKAPLKKRQAYNGIVEGLLAAPLKVSVQKDETVQKEMQQLMDALFEEAKYYIVAEETEAAADYVVQVRNGMYYITLPSDRFRPVTAPQPIKNKNAANAIAAQLMQISQWTFLKTLQNQSVDALPDAVLKVELTVGKSMLPALNETSAAQISYANVNGSWENTIRVKLINTSEADLYCSALYLTSDFSSDSQFLSPPVYLLESGNAVNLSFEKNTSLTLELNDVVKFYNWKEEVEYLKIITSTEPFDVQALSLAPLPKPPLPGASRKRDAKETSTTRGIRRKTLSGWATRTITLRLQNPLADKLREGDKKVMLADTDTAYFARGLYSTLR